MCRPLTGAPASPQLSETFATESGDDPLIVVADPQRLSQVVSNLVSNACKFVAADSGEVECRVSLERWRSPEEMQGPALVEDGVGPDPLHSLPEPMRQQLLSVVQARGIQHPEWYRLVISVR